MICSLKSSVNFVAAEASRYSNNSFADLLNDRVIDVIANFLSGGAIYSF